MYKMCKFFTLYELFHRNLRYCIRFGLFGLERVHRTEIEDAGTVLPEILPVHPPLLGAKLQQFARHQLGGACCRRFQIVPVR